MMSEEKKRRIKLSALFGAISGAVVAAVLYFVVAPSVWYFAIVPIAAIMGAGQAYVSPE